MVSAHYGVYVPPEHIRQLCNIHRQGVSLAGIQQAAESLGFTNIAVQINHQQLIEEAPLPAILHWNANHFIVLYQYSKKKWYSKQATYHIADPAFGKIKLTEHEFKTAWLGNNYNEKSEGYALLLEPGETLYTQAENNFNQINQPNTNFGLGFLWQYVKPYKSLLLQLFLGLLIATLLQLIFPILTQSIIDKGVNYKNIGFVGMVLIAQIIIQLAQTLVEFLRSRILLYITGRVNIALTSAFLQKVMHLPISFFDTKHFGDIMQRITDNEKVQHFLSSETLNTLFSIMSLCVFSILMWYYSSTIFTFFVCCTVLYIIWVMAFMRYRAILNYKLFETQSQNQQNILQLIQAISEIKLNNSERKRRTQWESIQAKLYNTNYKSLNVSQIQAIGSFLIVQLQNIIVTYLSAKAVIDNQISLGAMLSIQYMLGALNVPVAQFVQFLQILQDTKISLARLSEIHTQENEDANIKQNLYSSLKGNIVLDNVSFGYTNDTEDEVLHNINCTIPYGKTTAIVGESGSGKTTLLKLLLKFYEIKKGKITVEPIKETELAQNLNQIPANEWRKRCGAVMQEGFIFGDTILNNIVESEQDFEINQSRLEIALKISNVYQFAQHLPQGLQTQIGNSGIALSGGQKQRVLIARAVYKNPEYLFFDEATSALDANNEHQITHQLQSFLLNKTAVIIAHRLSTVKNADQIMVIDKGRIAEVGNHKELVQKKGIYFNLVKNQLELSQ